MKDFHEHDLPEHIRCFIIIHKYRIQEDMVADLTKDLLKDIGICAVGDIVLILKHCKNVRASF